MIQLVPFHKYKYCCQSVLQYNLHKYSGHAMIGLTLQEQHLYPPLPNDVSSLHRPTTPPDVLALTWGDSSKHVPMIDKAWMVTVTA